MPTEHRVTIRLPEDLFAQLDARSRQGQPVAAIVRQALLEYLARQPDEPIHTADLDDMLAATVARLDDLVWLKFCVASRRLPMIVAEQATAAIPPHHVPRLTTIDPLRCDKSVVEPLVIALRMIVGQVLGCVPLACG